jgi:hypothetical protein
MNHNKLNKLTGQLVTDLFFYCAIKNLNETPAIQVEGLSMSMKFSLTRLLEKKEVIKDLLQQTHKNFHSENGVDGGWTFMNFHVDDNQLAWGDQFQAQELMMLGMAVNLVKYCAPKSEWPNLPMGVPYIRFLVNN